MERKVIAIANHKGGVGKTSSVASIGAALARKGHRTLLVDLDSQANLTGSLLADAGQRTIYNALTERKGLPVRKVSDTLYVVPSSMELAGVEMELNAQNGREQILKGLLEQEAQGYSFVLLDCPPSLELIAVNAFVASTDVLIPLTAEALPFQGLTAIEDILQIVKENLNGRLRLSGIFLTRWQGVRLNNMVEQALRRQYGETLLRTKIRTNIAIAEAPLAKEDIYTYSPKCNGAQDYEALTEELLQKILI